MLPLLEEGVHDTWETETLAAATYISCAHGRAARSFSR
jgi:hypothetical protein